VSNTLFSYGFSNTTPYRKTQVSNLERPAAKNGDRKALFFITGIKGSAVKATLKKLQPSTATK
jgi:hypothetical protein